MQPGKPGGAEPPDRSDPSSPYGPHPSHVDEASGGADSSPFETLSSDERERRRDADRPDEDRGDQGESSRH